MQARPQTSKLLLDMSHKRGVWVNPWRKAQAHILKGLGRKRMAHNRGTEYK